MFVTLRQFIKSVIYHALFQCFILRKKEYSNKFVWSFAYFVFFRYNDFFVTTQLYFKTLSNHNSYLAHTYICAFGSNIFTLNYISGRKIFLEIKYISTYCKKLFVFFCHTDIMKHDNAFISYQMLFFYDNLTAFKVKH